MSVEVKVHPGQLPPLWGLSATFFSNLHALFFDNEGETAMLEEQVKGIKTYGGRLAPIIDLLFRGGRNMLVLEAAPDPALLGYFRDRLGLSLPEVEILPHGVYQGLGSGEGRAGADGIDGMLERIGEHPSDCVDGFVTDSTLARLAGRFGKPTLSTVEGSRRGNNKLRLVQFLEASGLPTFDTEVADCHADLGLCLERIGRRGYRRAVVKSQLGASGIGMMRLEARPDEAERVPPCLFFEGPCLVQGWIEDAVDGARVLGSPSVQIFAGEDAVHLYDLTEQILSHHSVHEGNMSPPPYLDERPWLREEILRQAGMAATWLHDQGYRGTASADFLLVERDGDVTPIVCEINARVTGATYPAVLSRHFMPRGAWLMRNLSFRQREPAGALLSGLERTGCLFAPGRERGALPINFNSDSQGRIQKGQFLCMGADLEDCRRVLAEVESQLPVETQYDRD